MRYTASSYLTLLTALSSVTCNQTVLTDADVPSLSFEIVSGDGQTGLVGQELTNPLVVRALDGTGKAVKKELVNFVVTAGGGSMFAGASITDNDGLAQDYLTLGTEPGENVVQVRAVNPTTGQKHVYATFTATGEPPFTRFVDEAAFLSATGAVATVTFPSARGNTPAPYVENGVSLRHANGFNNAVNDFNGILLPGNEFGVSGAENIDIELATSVHAFGLWMQDGFAVGNIGGPGVDSQFEFSFIADGIVVVTLTEDPPIDAAFFLGVLVSPAIDKVEIREVGSTVTDFGPPFNENDFFGTIYTSTSLPGG
jgi:hypothetical protein